MRQDKNPPNETQTLFSEEQESSSTFYTAYLNQTFLAAAPPYRVPHGRWGGGSQKGPLQRSYETSDHLFCAARNRHGRRSARAPAPQRTQTLSNPMCFGSTEPPGHLPYCWLQGPFSSLTQGRRLGGGRAAEAAGRGSAVRLPPASLAHRPRQASRSPSASLRPPRGGGGRR